MNIIRTPVLMRATRTLSSPCIPDPFPQPQERRIRVGPSRDGGRGASADDIQEFMGHAASRRAGLEGDLDNDEACCGASIGLIHEIRTVRNVIESLADGYLRILKKR